MAGKFGRRILGGLVKLYSIWWILLTRQLFSTIGVVWRLKYLWIALKTTKPQKFLPCGIPPQRKIIKVKNREKQVFKI